MSTLSEDTCGAWSHFVFVLINTKILCICFFLCFEGCNKTFNFGPLFYVFDHEAGVAESELEYMMISEEEANPDEPLLDPEDLKDLFDPLYDRHLEHMQSSYEGIVTNVSKGQELFCNYVFFSSDETWKFNILQLRSECHGESVGTITEVEGEEA